MDEKQIIKNLEDFFAKAPHLPKSWRDLIVKVVPWLALIFGILGILGGISALGVSPAAALGGVNNSFTLIVAGIAGIISSVLSLMAFPHLRAHAYRGWQLSAYALVVNIIASVVTLDLLGAVLGFLIGFYFLFEIKSYYK